MRPCLFPSSVEEYVLVVVGLGQNTSNKPTFDCQKIRAVYHLKLQLQCQYQYQYQYP